MTVLGYEERRDDNGRRVKTDTTKDYTVQLVNEFEAAESVARPFAYLVPPAFRQAVETLQRHGLDVEELREDIELDLEAYKVDARRERCRGGSTGPSRSSCAVTPRDGPARAGRHVGGADRAAAGTPGGRDCSSRGPRTAWPPGTFFDAGLKAGEDFPVLRLPKPAPLYTTGAEPLPEDRGPLRPITLDGRRRRCAAGARGRFGFGGQARWLDGAHWLQPRDGRLLVFDATDRPFEAVPRRPGADEGPVPPLVARAR